MKTRDENYSRVLKNISLFGGVQGVILIVGLVRNKLIAILLGPEGMGLASLFNTAVNFISQATNLGISFSAVKHVSELFDRGDEAAISHFVRVVRAWSLLTALVGMLVCIVIGPLLSQFTFFRKASSFRRQEAPIAQNVPQRLSLWKRELPSRRILAVK